MDYQRFLEKLPMEELQDAFIERFKVPPVKVKRRRMIAMLVRSQHLPELTSLPPSWPSPGFEGSPTFEFDWREGQFIDHPIDWRSDNV